MIQDRNVLPTAGVALKHIPCIRATVPISQSDLELLEFVPGKRFIVEEVQVYVSAIVAAGTIDVKVGGASVLSTVITPVADAAVVGALAGAAVRKGGSATTVTVHVTTDGSGILTDLQVTFAIRFIDNPE